MQPSHRDETALRSPCWGTRAGIARAGMVQSVMTMGQQSGMAQPTMMQSGVAMAMPVAMMSGEHIRFHATIAS